MPPHQPDLFTAAVPTFPDGMKYEAEFLSPKEEEAPVSRFAQLQFKPFEFQNYLFKRRAAYFGCSYDYGARALEPATPMPDFLLPVRARAATFADIPADELRQAMVTEYAPGAGIGWHRDRSAFGEVIGLSLMSACSLRFRRPEGRSWG